MPTSGVRRRRPGRSRRRRAPDQHRQAQALGHVLEVAHLRRPATRRSAGWRRRPRRRLQHLVLVDDEVLRRVGRAQDGAGQRDSRRKPWKYWRSVSTDRQVWRPYWRAISAGWKCSRSRPCWGWPSDLGDHGGLVNLGSEPPGGREARAVALGVEAPRPRARNSAARHAGGPPLPGA